MFLALHSYQQCSAAPYHYNCSLVLDRRHQVLLQHLFICFTSHVCSPSVCSASKTFTHPSILLFFPVIHHPMPILTSSFHLPVLSMASVFKLCLQGQHHRDVFSVLQMTLVFGLYYLREQPTGDLQDIFFSNCRPCRTYPFVLLCIWAFLFFFYPS